MTTLLLDQSNWDLVVDAAGNLAVADNPYARAQDVCSAVRLYKGESYYDAGRGVPYHEKIFGKPLNYDMLNTQFNIAAKSVAGVTDAKTRLTGFTNRGASGILYFSTTGQVRLSNGIATILKV